MSQIILASASPRRRELLEQIGLEFEIIPSRAQEVITSSVPKEVVMELSRQKAEEVAKGILSYQENHKKLVSPQDILVLGSDTVVAIGDRILGKPGDEAEAKEMLSLLSGQTHSVFTGVACVFLDGEGRCREHVFYEETKVTMQEMSEKEIDRYVATKEPMDKAGAYGIQGACAIYIKEIKGDYNNVVGLPLSRLYAELKALGIDLLA